MIHLSPKKTPTVPPIILQSIVMQEEIESHQHYFPLNHVWMEAKLITRYAPFPFSSPPAVSAVVLFQPRNVRVVTSGPPGNSWMDQPRHGQSSHALAPGQQEAWRVIQQPQAKSILNEILVFFFQNGFHNMLTLHTKLRTCHVWGG